MNRYLFGVALVATGLLLHAQSAQVSPQPKLAFEVVSIRPSGPIDGQNQVTGGVRIDGSQVRCVLCSLKDYLRWAYNVKDYQIQAPDWMAGARFDINGKLPAGTTGDQTRDMVASMLADRFQVKFHRETKELPVYALVVAKGGPKLTESPKEAAADPDAPKGAFSVVSTTNSSGTTIDLGKGSSMTIGENKIVGQRVQMLAFVDMLARFVDKPVTDATGLTGTYDFSLEFTPEDFRAMMIRSALIAGVTLPPEVMKLLDSSSGDSALSALEKVGLKLEPRKSPIEMLVVDHAEKAPTDN